MSGIGKFLEKLFVKLFSLDKYKYEKIRIKKDVAYSIMHFAKINYPNEFIAFLKGSVKNKILEIDGLVYQPYGASRRSAYMRAVLPSSSDTIGSVHSHPTPSPFSKPSPTDLQTFGKRGLVHFIINYPYNVNNLTAYNSRGDVLEFEIVE